MCSPVKVTSSWLLLLYQLSEVCVMLRSSSRGRAQRVYKRPSLIMSQSETTLSFFTCQSFCIFGSSDIGLADVSLVGGI